MDYAAALLSRLPGSSPRRSKDLKQLVETLEDYLPSEQVEDVLRAYEFGALAHEGQTRLSGDPIPL